MSSSSSQIKKGAAISYLSLAVGIVTSLVYMPWMVGMIGKSNYALYTLASSFISMFVMDFGLSASVSRFVAKYNAEGRQEDIDRLVSTICALYMVLDCVILLVLSTLYFFIDYIYVGLTAEEVYIFRQLYIISGLYSIVSFPFLPLDGILGAFELFVQQKSAELLNKLLTVSFVIIALLNGGDVRTLVIANALSGLFAIAMKLFFVKRRARVYFRPGHFNKRMFIEVAQFSVWATVRSLAYRMTYLLTPSVLGVVSNSNEIALFAPANYLEGYFYTISAAINGLFLATVSRYVASEDEERINDLMIRVGRYQFMVMGLVFVGFFCIGRSFLSLWMGREFEGAWRCALLLFVPDMLIYSEQIANTTVVVRNKIKKQAIGYVVMAVSCVVLSVPLSSALGAYGASLAISVGFMVLFVYMNHIFKHDLNIDVEKFFKECYAKLVPPMILVAIACYFITNTIISIPGWLGLLAKGAVVSILYAVTFAFFLNESERGMIKRILPWK